MDIPRQSFTIRHRIAKERKTNIYCRITPGVSYVLRYHIIDLLSSVALRRIRFKWSRFTPGSHLHNGFFASITRSQRKINVTHSKIHLNEIILDQYSPKHSLLIKLSLKEDCDLLKWVFEHPIYLEIKSNKICIFKSCFAMHFVRSWVLKDNRPTFLQKRLSTDICSVVDELSHILYRGSWDVRLENLTRKMLPVKKRTLKPLTFFQAVNFLLPFISACNHSEHSFTRT